MNQIKSATTAEVSTDDLDCGDFTRLPAAPLVSIHMITYQHAAFIKEALDSVLMQKVQFPYEICLGEDGSTDGTREICLEYARKYPDKIRLFLRNRANPARSYFKAPYMFNAASTFNACRGKYIAFLEGDDYWTHPHKLQLQVDQLEFDPTQAASCHFAVSMDDGTPWVAGITPTYPIESFELGGILRREVGNIHTSTWLLRRGKPMEWESFRTCLFGEYPIIIWTLLQGSARVLPRILSLYRIHEGGAFSPLSYEIRLRENVELWRSLESIIPPDIRSSVVIGLSRTLTLYTAVLRKAGKFRLALAAFKSNLSTIARVRTSSAQRRQLQLLAFESLVAPRLPGLRARLREWRSQS